MADRIDISAQVRVIDQASAALKSIQGSIQGIGNMAKAAGASLAAFARQGAFGGLQANLANVRGAMGNVLTQAKNLVAPLVKLGAVFGIAGITGTIASMREWMTTASQLGRAAGRLGISVEGLQGFQFMVGDADRANEALSKLQKTMTVAAGGGKAGDKLAALFKRMGVSMQEIRAGNLDAILPQIADAFERNVNPTTRARMALALFGRAGQQMIPFLARGRAGLEQARAAMERLGIITPQMVERAAELRTAFREFNASIQGTRNVLMSALAPAFTPILQTMTQWILANREWIASSIEAGVSALAGAAKYLWGQIEAVVSAMGGWQNVLAVVAGLMSARLIGSVFNLAGALAKLGVSAIALNPLSIALGALTAAGIYAYQNWDTVGPAVARGMEAITGISAETWQNIATEAKKSVNAIMTAWKTGGIGGAALQAVQEVQKHWAAFVPWFSEQFPQIAATARDAFRSIREWGERSWNAIRAAWQEGGLLGAVEQAWAAVKTGATGAANWIKDQFNAIDWSVIGGLARSLFENAWKAGLTIGTWLRDRLREVDWAGIGTWARDAFTTAWQTVTGFGKWLGEQLRAVDWPGIGAWARDAFTTAWQTVTGFGTWLGEQLRAVDWAGIGRDIASLFNSAAQAALDLATWLGEQLRAVDWSGIGTIAGNLLKSAFQAVADVATWLQGLDWGKVGEAAGRLIGAALSIEITPQQAGDMLLSIGRAIVAAGDALLNIGLQLAEGLVRGLIQGLGQKGQDVVNFLKSWLPAPLQGLLDFATPAAAAAPPPAQMAAAQQQLADNVIRFPGRGQVPAAPPGLPTAPAAPLAPTPGVSVAESPAVAQQSLIRQIQALPVRLEGEIQQRMRVDMSPDLRAMLIENRANTERLRTQVEVGQSMGAALGEVA